MAVTIEPTVDPALVELDFDSDFNDPDPYTPDPDAEYPKGFYLDRIVDEFFDSKDVVLSKITPNLSGYDTGAICMDHFKKRPDWYNEKIIQSTRFQDLMERFHLASKLVTYMVLNSSGETRYPVKWLLPRMESINWAWRFENRPMTIEEITFEVYYMSILQDYFRNESPFIVSEIEMYIDDRKCTAEYITR